MSRWRGPWLGDWLGDWEGADSGSAIVSASATATCSATVDVGGTVIPAPLPHQIEEHGGADDAPSYRRYLEAQERAHVAGAAVADAAVEGAETPDGGGPADGRAALAVVTRPDAAEIAAAADAAFALAGAAVSAIGAQALAVGIERREAERLLAMRAEEELIALILAQE